ncbi:hypothetical protein OIO90_000374 [Microbotryomycetes sp. JL221]|nr:hypothetical protein OIO90_000374 [Microbotryomycetes sp. JL221]
MSDVESGTSTKDGATIAEPVVNESNAADVAAPAVVVAQAATPTPADEGAGVASTADGGAATKDDSSTESNAMDQDPLAGQEFDVLGVEAEDQPLPAPPRGATVSLQAQNGAADALAAPGPRTTSRAAANVAPLVRNKRPKNVKFSPQKGKQAGRRSMTSGAGAEAGALGLDPPPKPPRGWFRDLLHKLDLENPKVFQLTPEIKGIYKNIVAGPGGELIDTTEHRPPSKVTGRPIGQEDRDGYRMKDKSGKGIFCYSCSESASMPKQRRIISCDFCDQHWHLDCLDPPMVGMPPPTRKWMCPLHSDHVMPRKRIPKATTIVPVQEARQRNNGDIVVVSRPSRVLDDDRYEETLVNRVRFQIPEDIIVLDFWKKAQKMQASEKAWEATWQQWGLEPTPYRQGRSRLKREWEDLVEICKQAHLDLWTSAEPSLVDVKPLSSSQSIHDGSAPGSTADIGNVPLPATTTTMTSSTTGITRPTPPEDSVDSAPQPPTKRQRMSLIGPSGLSSVSQIPPYKGNKNGHVGTGIGSTTTTTTTTTTFSSNLNNNSDFLKRNSTTTSNTGSSGAVITGVGASSTTNSTNRRSAMSPATPSLPTEVTVKSKEDLKALMHVRKLMASLEGKGVGGGNDIDPEMKAALLGFIEGAPVVPKLDFMRPEVLRQPWELPWEDESTTKSNSASPVASRGAGSTTNTTTMTDKKREKTPIVAVKDKTQENKESSTTVAGL